MKSLKTKSRFGVHFWSLLLVAGILMSALPGTVDAQDIPDNPKPVDPPPAATVAMEAAAKAVGVLAADEGPTLTPERITATLKPGECIAEHKTAYIPGAPPKGDVMFAVDLTGSMGGELSNVKANSINIMNAVRGVIPDTDFGVISHMDYVDSFSGCSYSDTYGDAAYGDYPYSLDQVLTSNTANVASALSALSLGYGADGPESYTRVFYESYSDGSIGWRSGAKRILLSWQDANPHDCNYQLDCGGSGSTGPDPGRNEIAGDADDLDLAASLQGMADNNITLIALHSGSLLSLWDCYADKTGGDAIQINFDGTIPGGADIGTFVADLIEAEISHIDELTLAVCTPGFEDWLVLVDPAAYTDIDLEGPETFEFDIEICVPEDTEDGEYCFDICVVGDGVEYAKQEVCITVISEIEVAVDIKPGSCPNPLRVNFRGKGVLPVAILGSDVFDVNDIDIATITLEGVSPIRSAFDDVSTPFDGEECECSTEGADGIDDLVLKFDRQAILAALEVAYGDLTELPNRAELPLILTAMLIGKEVELTGTDCLTILNRGAIKRRR